MNDTDTEKGTTPRVALTPISSEYPRYYIIKIPKNVKERNATTDEQKKVQKAGAFHFLDYAGLALYRKIWYSRSVANT